jgi:hypothetical protein
LGKVARGENQSRIRSLSQAPRALERINDWGRGNKLGERLLQAQGG